MKVKIINHKKVTVDIENMCISWTLDKGATVEESAGPHDGQRIKIGRKEYSIGEHERNGSSMSASLTEVEACRRTDVKPKATNEKAHKRQSG